MSLWSSIAKGVKKVASSFSAKKVLSKVAPIASVALPGVGGVAAGLLVDNAINPSGGNYGPTTAPPATSLPSIPEPGFGGAVHRALPGGETGYLSPGKFKYGKLSGNVIPVGYHEKMSPAGVIYLTKSRRRRGITYRDLATFRRVHRTLKNYAKKCK